MYILIYLDFEATGLSCWYDHITEIGAKAVYVPGSDKSKSNEFISYVYTDRVISCKASEITGITNQTIKDAPNMGKVMKMFFDWLDKLRTTSKYNMILVAYNGMNYDFPMFMSELHRWSFNIPRMLKSRGIIGFLDPLIWCKKYIDDTLLLRKKSGKCSFSLGNVHLALMGTSLDNAHRAIVDTRGMMNICEHAAMEQMHVYINQVTQNQENHDPNKTFYTTVDIMISNFFKKRRQIDTAIKNNTKSQINSLEQMISRKRKRKIDSI